MKELDFYAGMTIDKAVEYLKKHKEETGEDCYGTFNGKQLLSTESLDDAYIKVTGKTKEEMEREEREWREEYERKEAEFKATIPQKEKEMRERARGLVLEDKLEYWDKIVPIRLGDIYHGMELDQTLAVCEIMGNEDVDYDERLRKAYDLFMDSGHSGMSAGLTAAMFREFCPHGYDLADAVMNFRFENKEEKK